LGVSVRSLFSSRVMQPSARDELLAYTLTRGDSEFIHQHAVDALAASDIEGSKAIQVFFGLAGLYLFLERGNSGRKVQAAHAFMSQIQKVWPVFDRPLGIAGVSVEYVLGFRAGEARDAAVLRWCRAVWEMWGAEREGARRETDRLLEGWLGPGDQETER